MPVIPRSHRFPLTGSWRERAACRNAKEPEIFDLPTRMAANDDYARARALCASCPVASDCYAWAKADYGFEGIAGGHLWQGDVSRQGRRSAVPC